jgi:hypothetical protein
MKVVLPITIDKANLTLSSVAILDNPVYSILVSYNIGDKVTYNLDPVNGDRNYESLIGANLDNDPSLDDGSKWLDLGPSNRWKMFDELNQSQSIDADLIYIKVTLGEVVNSISLLNISARTVQIIMTDPIDGIVYDETINLISDSGINNWYDYYFLPIERINSLVITDLPVYPDAIIDVNLSDTGLNVAMGVLAFGLANNIGITDYGTGIGIVDYSIKSLDSFGNFTITPRAFSKRADYAVTLKTERVAAVQNLLSSLRTTPAVWIGNENFASTIIYGYYRDFDIVLSDFSNSECSITVEGLT